MFFKSLFLCQGQTIHYPLSNRHAGGSAYSKNFIDVFTSVAQPAAPVSLSGFTCGILVEKRFLLEELNIYSFAAGFKRKSDGFGFTMNYSGNTDYNESQLGISYSKDLGNIDIGIQFNYFLLRIAGYGNDGALTFEVATIWHISEKVHTGLHVQNPAGGRFRKIPDEKLATVVSWGIGYEPSSKVLIHGEIIKEENKPTDFIAGFQYSFIKKFFGRAGIITSTGTLYWGIGLGWKNIRMDVIASYHPQLGVSTNLLFSFSKLKGI